MNKVLILLGVVFLSCGCDKRNKDSHMRGAVMRMCTSTDPATIDPRRNGDFWSSNLLFFVYEGLTRILPNGEAELALAETVEIAEDGCTYLFKLRDAVWTDGAPLTAYDFEHTWKTSIDPKFAAACPYLLYPVKNAEKIAAGELPSSALGVKAIDAHTLEVELEHPTPYFLSLITFCNFFATPKHIESIDPKWEHKRPEELVFSGPFKVKSWVRNKEIVLEKNPDYWNAENIHLDKVHVYIIPEERTALRMFDQKEIDFLSTVTMPISIDDLGQLKRTGKLEVFPTAGYTSCSFNMGRFPFQNVNIRKAFSYAIDRSSLVNNITQLAEKPATRIVPPALHNHTDRDFFTSFDPILAKECLQKGLQELGLSHEEFCALKDTWVLSCRSSEVHRRIAQALQNFWQQTLGIKVQLREMEYKSLLQSMMNKSYSMGIENSIAQYVDPISILERFKYKTAMKNYPGYENAAYIDLLDKSNTIQDPHQRREVLEKAEALLAADMPFAPLFFMQQGVMMSPSLMNAQYSPLSNLLFTKLIPKKEVYGFPD